MDKHKVALAAFFALGATQASHNYADGGGTPGRMNSVGFASRMGKFEKDLKRRRAKNKAAKASRKRNRQN